MRPGDRVVVRAPERFERGEYEGQVGTVTIVIGKFTVGVRFDSVLEECGSCGTRVPAIVSLHADMVHPLQDALDLDGVA